MEKFDKFVRHDFITGIHGPVKPPKTLTRCCSTPQLGSYMGGSSRSPVVEPVVVGTGVYFHNLHSNSTLNSDCELQNLFNLAAVACEVESSLKRRQLVKKHRTPRNILWINRTRIANGNCWPWRGLPARADAANSENIGNQNELYSPAGLEDSTLDSSAFSKLTAKNRRTSKAKVLKFSLQRNTVMCQTAGSRMKCIRLAKGSGRLPSACSTKLSRPRAGELPVKDTRVQGFAKKILQFVGEGSTAEKFIRGALGNNPDTSKALRLLLRQQKVKRLGDGGRGKAYLYAATQSGLRELDELNDGLITYGNSSTRRRSIHCQLQGDHTTQKAVKSS